MTRIIPFPIQDETRLVVDQISESIVSHMNWLQSWHRTVVCGTATPEEVLDPNGHLTCSLGCWLKQHQHNVILQQPVFEKLVVQHKKLHDNLYKLALITANGGHVTSPQYDSLNRQVQSFIKISQRIIESFQLVMSDLDPLTGLRNRQSMSKTLNRERELYIRTNAPFCIGLADVDHFKAINDAYGSGVGDMILAAIGNYFVTHVRPYDTIFRYGGEEVLFLFPCATLEEGKAALERLKKNISKLTLASNDHIDIHVTISFGLAQMEDDIAIEELIERADSALYRAKKEGRNRVCLWQPKYIRETGLAVS